ncbi:hypothetical protein M9H77_19445 [Catharanthus roseus]|uniref:Uncharacterized protein n=1 Tax=Catharanthus roseus TaxID=4058 RepID=A0ACC0BAF9_CATRO|nr:hypothetical protein M9H77_19445 [Catharanthus roseus]
MMHMTFYWGRTVTLLFDFWKTDSWSSYTVTLLACILFSMFYQYLEDRRLRFKILSRISSSAAAAAAAQESSADSTTTTTPLLIYAKKLGIKRGQWTVPKLVGSVLFGVNSAIGYLLMLAVMSFNGGVFVAVVVGLALGYLLFRSGDEDVVVVDNPCACA